MPEIRDYLRNRVHSDEEYRHLVEQVEQTAERANRLEGLLEYVAMMSDIELPEEEPEGEESSDEEEPEEVEE